MEPDKTYQLHPDGSQSGGAPKSDDIQTTELKAPSQYNDPQSKTQNANTTPWYLRPLTKSSSQTLTSEQTRPYIAREPSAPRAPAMIQHAVSDSSADSSTEPSDKKVDTQANSTTRPVPVSPFRSPQSNPYAPRTPSYVNPAASLLSPERFTMPVQSKSAVYGEALSNSAPKPFSQFNSSSPTQPVNVDSRIEQGRLRKIFGVIVALLVMGAIVLGLFMLLRDNTMESKLSPQTGGTSDEDRFYNAVENRLSTSNIRQIRTQTIETPDRFVINIDAASDFSDSKTPKSYIKYNFKSGVEASEYSGAGELIIDNREEYYAKLTKPAVTYSGSEKDRPAENQWYRLKNDDPGSNYVDPLSTRLEVNTSLGEFPIGNFNDNVKRQMLQYVKDNQIYTIRSSAQVKVDGKNATRYKIESSADKINELHKRIYTALEQDGMNSPQVFAAGEILQREVWVDNETNRIVKIKYEQQQMNETGNSTKEIVTIAITYPNDNSDIRAPEAARLYPVTAP